MDPEQKKEAAIRMVLMGVNMDVVSSFLAGIISFIECGHYIPMGQIPDEYRKPEEEYGGLVYLVIRTDTADGVLDNVVYVPRDPELWEIEKEDILEGYVFAWCFNRTYPELSEYGTIGYSVDDAGAIHRIV